MGNIINFHNFIFVVANSNWSVSVYLFRRRTSQVNECKTDSVESNTQQYVHQIYLSIILFSLKNKKVGKNDASRNITFALMN